MDAFTTFKAIGIPIDIANCDTDQIIPARFLRHPADHPEYDRFLFHDLRFNEDGSEKPDFNFNKAPYRDGKVIVAEINWGCGSSREHAALVLAANGIRAVVAPSFGDIHYSNCIKNGILPVRLPRADCDRLRAQLHELPGAEISFDLEAQTVIGPDGTSYSFEIGEFNKYKLLNGLDDLTLTLSHEADISAFEERHGKDYDWL